jgi:hypothetical protein
MNDTMDLALVNEDYDTYLRLTDVAFEANMISEAQRDQNRKLAAGKEAGNQLAQGYAEALKNGTQDEYMQELGEQDLDAETIEAFSTEKNRIDLFAKEAAKQQKIKRELEFQKYWRSVDANTPIEAIDTYAKENDLGIDHINKLYNAKYEKQKAEQIVGGLWSDSASATNRKAMDSQVTMGETVEESLDNMVLLSSTARIAPMKLSNGLENLARSTEPIDMATGGEAYLKYMATADDVPLQLADGVQARYSYYEMLRNDLNMPPGQAATATVANFANVTEDSIKMNRQAWNDPAQGTDQKTAPQELVYEAVVDAISDPSGPLKNRMIAKQGIFFDTNFEDMQIPPELSALINSIGENQYALNNRSEQAAISSTIRLLADSGWAATDVNKGVKVTDENEYNYQYQRHPVTYRKDGVVPASVPRSLLQDDIGGIKFLVDASNNKARPYTEKELSFGEGEPDPNRPGQMRWPVLYRGSTMRFADGSNANLPLYFYYEDESQQTSEQPPTPFGPVVERQTTGVMPTVDPGLNLGVNQ